MTSQIRRILAVLTAFTATISACQTSQAAPVVWSGAGTDMNWSTSANWFGGTPPGTGDDVKFFDLGGGGGFGVVDNIVDINSTNLSLQFANTNNAIVHTTQINPGVTLMLTGSGGLINGNEQSNDTRVTNSITGVGGTLIVSNTAANIQVRQPFGTSSTANRTTLDMSGLDTFNATVARLLVGVAGERRRFNRATGRLLPCHAPMSSPLPVRRPRWIFLTATAAQITEMEARFRSGRPTRSLPTASPSGVHARALPRLTLIRHSVHPDSLSAEPTDYPAAFRVGRWVMPQPRREPSLPAAR